MENMHTDVRVHRIMSEKVHHRRKFCFLTLNENNSSEDNDEVAFQHVCFPFKKINLVTFQGEALLTFLREIEFLSSKFHSIIEVLTVQKRVNKVAFLLSNALRVSTAASLKVVSNTADPRLRFGSLSESVLDPVPRIRFSRVRS